MPFFDLPLDQLREYKPARTDSPDFDAFWAQTLTEARAHPLDAQFTPLQNNLALLDTWDVTFNGYGGAPIRGWFLAPKQRTGRLPCMVQYLGYGCGRGYITEFLLWATAGYATLVRDNRGQSAWVRGDTGDPDGTPDPHFLGFMTQGILDPRTYYYRRLFTDAVRAVEAVQAHPATDPERIGIVGGSQGGGISLAVAGLSDTVSLALIDVPFLCNFEAAIGMTGSDPYHERDTPETVLHTLSYFDGMNFAARARAKALFAVALMDDVCPPRTVFAAHNHYAGEKAIRVYPYNGHEGGGSRHDQEKLALAAAHFGL
jgi:cephalosporin-C deacetylase